MTLMDYFLNCTSGHRKEEEEVNNIYRGDRE